MRAVFDGIFADGAIQERICPGLTSIKKSLSPPPFARREWVCSKDSVQQFAIRPSGRSKIALSGKPGTSVVELNKVSRAERLAVSHSGHQPLGDCARTAGSILFNPFIRYHFAVRLGYHLRSSGDGGDVPASALGVYPLNFSRTTASTRIGGASPEWLSRCCSPLRHPLHHRFAATWTQRFSCRNLIQLNH